MPSRRTVLTGAVAAGAGTLAGCSALDDTLPRARQGDDPQLPDGGTVVATDESLKEARPHGAFFQSSVAVRHRNELHLYTRHQLIPGTNQYDTDWRLSGATVEHDFGGLDPVGTVDGDASYEWVSSESDSSGTRIGLGREPNEREQWVRWHVSYDPASDATWGPEFVTRVRVEDTFADGDSLATCRLAVRNSRWPFGSAEHETTTELVYGRDG